MKLSHVNFVKSAAKIGQCPDEDVPEVAFAGRSNVGKSSLMNMLFNRRRLVKVSSTPGRTQLLNYFSVNRSFHLVDLPGYGFAKAPKNVRENWRKLMRDYLSIRDQLAAVVLLLDIRRKPSDEDHAIIEMFRYEELPCILVVTKADKLPLQKRRKQVLSITGDLGLEPGDCIVTSTLKKWGREELWNSIECFVAPDPS